LHQATETQLREEQRGHGSSSKHTRTRTSRRRLPRRSRRGASGKTGARNYYRTGGSHLSSEQTQTFESTR
ncbi:unnamed protein product, partial [Amoebophrya sp. A25]